MKYRVWCDPAYNKGESEDVDGEDYETGEGPRHAAEMFAKDRYRDLQHIEPGVFLVRAEDGTLTRWRVGVQVTFVARSMVLPTEESKP